MAITFNHNDKVYVSGGSLGVGTDSPSDRLEVYNSGGDVAIRIHEDAGTHEARLHLRRGGSDWELINSHDFLIEGEGTERFRIQTGTGNIGIGTTSPNNPLHINVGDSGDNFLQFTNSTTGTGSNDGLIVGIDTDESGLVWNRENVHLKFGTNNAEKMRITATGRLGIGTSSPQAELHVNGSGSTGYLHLTNSTSGSTINDGMTVGVNGSNYFVFVREAAPLYFGTNATERMRITSDGKVGIGTTDPSAYAVSADDLVVRGSGDTGITIATTNTTKETNLYFSDGTTGNDRYRGGLQYRHDTNHLGILANGSEKMRITSTGDVGIGTTSPSAKLEVSSKIKIGGNNSPTLTLKPTALSGASQIVFENATTTGVLGRIYYDISTNSMRFWTANTERMRITSSGNVGIGTTTPDASAILEIKSTTQGVLFPKMTEVQKDAISSPATGLIIYQTDGTEGLYIYKSTGWTHII